MNAKAATCPPEEVLADFGLGKLDDRATETINTHLETCVDCRNMVAGMSGDSFLNRLREAHGQPPANPVPSPARIDRTIVPGESLANAQNSSETIPPHRRTAPPQKPAADLVIPPELMDNPDYEVLKELGRGGMGVVYLARNRAMDRLEVLKVVNKQFLDRPGALERFQQEIRSAAKLSHPNIVAAHSVPRLGDLLVFAMEYVDGQDLSQVVKQRGRLPVTNATFYIHQAALGLQHAFEKGMVHRDIKPNNLMLAIENKKHVVKILDFGLAKATSEKAAEGGLTQTGQILGTPDYIAPEQTLAAQKADIRADIYSLGCTLYYLLAGHVPFHGASLYEILQAHHQTEAQSLNLVRADVPAELAVVVAKMMAKDPAKRYQTPLEVAKALNPFFKAGGQAAPKSDLPPSVSPGIAPILPAPAALPIPVAVAQPAVPMATPVNVAPLDSFAEAERPRPKPRKKVAAKRRRLGLPINIGLLLFGGLIAAAAIFKFKTADGIVVVEVNEPNPEVFIDGNKATVTWDGGGTKAEIHVPVGSRNVELKKDGFKVSGRQVRIEQGTRTILTARLDRLPSPNAPIVPAPAAAPPTVVAPQIPPVQKVAPAVVLAAQSGKGPLDRRAILDAMSQPVRKTWNNVTVIDLARDLRSAYQMNVFVDKKNLNEAGIALDKKVTWKDARGSLDLALKMMLDPIGAGWTIRHDVLVISSKKGCETDMELVGYKTGPAVAMKVTAPRPAARDPQNPNAPPPSHSDFVDSVMQVCPTTWREVGGSGNRKLGRGILLVLQAFDVQREIERQFPGDLTRIELPATPAPNAIESDRALSTLVSLSLTGEPLSEVLQGLDEKSHVQILVKSRALEEAEIALDTPCHLEVDRVPLRTALEFLLQPFGLTYVIDGNAVFVTSIKDAAVTLTTSSYDVAKMIAAYGDAGDADAITDCVRDLVDPYWTWAAEGGPGMLRFSPDGRQLIVTQSYHGTVGVRRLFALVDKASADLPAAGAAAPRPDPAGAPPPAVAPFDAKQAKAHQAAWANHLGTKIETTNSVGAKMILIPPGEFLMGSTDEQVAAALKVAEEIKADQDAKDFIQKTERPQHRVAITKPFLMGATEVTVGQFHKFVEASKYVTETEKISDNQKRPNWRAPGYAVADESPVALITWNDAVAYCNWLSEQEKLEPGYRADVDSWLILPGKNGYRLPTEAEWEYVCRAGTTTQYSFGDDVALLEQYGWYNKNAGDRSHVVGTLLPNGFGLYDMHGNLYEWCQDYWDEKWYDKTPSNDPNGPFSGSDRVFRGGYCDLSASSCRSAYRYRDPPSSGNGSNGFRCVRVVNAQGTTAPLAAPATPAKPISNINDPAFQAWMKTVAALPAEKQIEAVAQKLVELNPGFDGKVEGFDPKSAPTIEKEVVTELRFAADRVTDISPVRALVGLKGLGCAGSYGGTGLLSDLSPLEGMKLACLEINRTQVSDLSPLKNMPLALLALFDCKQVSDLSPLKDLPLTYLGLFDCRQVGDLTPLAGLPLTNLDVGGCAQVHDLAPLRGMKLSILNLQGTGVRDLTLLQGMPLTELGLWGCDEIRDLSPLNKCPSLKSLNVKNTKVTAASVAALQKALPNCKIAWDDQAKKGARLSTPAPGASAPSLAIAPFDAKQARARQVAWAKHLGVPIEQTNSIGMKLVVTPPGEFMMGSPAGEEARSDDEGPQHRVRITRPFYLGATEVTQGQWETVMRTTPWKGQTGVQEGADFAATYVSWDDAVTFCQQLARRDGRTYRLPTEAEREFACRAGTTDAFSFGRDESRLGDYGWYGGIAGDGNAKQEQYAHPVGLKRANAFGLYDMHGNVYEWCSDWYDKDYYALSPGDDPQGPPAGSGRVNRGGGWSSTPQDCRSAFRFGNSSDFRSIILGFRVASSSSR